MAPNVASLGGKHRGQAGAAVPWGKVRPGLVGSSQNGENRPEK